MRDFIRIEIVSNCNHSCEYCFRDHGPVVVDVNDVIEKMELIFALYDHRRTVFRIECTGEITLYPDLIRYLDRKAEKDGQIIEVLSNGILAEAFAGLNSRLNWNFSLDGDTEQMNEHRKLTQPQITGILDLAVETDSEIQCVYKDQTIESMNSFISHLERRNYKGFLHIFPCRTKSESLEVMIDYRNLRLTAFTPQLEYFKRWEYIFQNGKRDFICDYFKNGYTYRIWPDRLIEMKCDCRGGNFPENYFGEKRTDYHPTDCSTCINHFEYNDSRRVMGIVGSG